MRSRPIGFLLYVKFGKTTARTTVLYLIISGLPKLRAYYRAIRIIGLVNNRRTSVNLVKTEEKKAYSTT